MIVMHVGGPDEWQARCGHCEWLSAIGPKDAADEAAARHACGVTEPTEEPKE